MTTEAALWVMWSRPEEPPEPPQAGGMVLLPSLRGSVAGPHLDLRTSGLQHWGEHMLLL